MPIDGSSNSWPHLEFGRNDAQAEKIREHLRRAKWFFEPNNLTGPGDRIRAEFMARFQLPQDHQDLEDEERQHRFAPPKDPRKEN